MKYHIRQSKFEDKTKIYDLYRDVARNKGGIAREENEISIEYIETNLKNSIKNGVCFIAVNKEDKIIAEIHSYKLNLKVFNHTLSELTIVVHPEFQKKGIGKLLFQTFLNHIKNYRDDILRVELIVRESNKQAIKLYQQLDFNIEGRFENRIANGNNNFEADIPMAWLNPNFKK